MHNNIAASFTKINSPEVRQVVALGRQRHWGFRVLDSRRGMIDRPVLEGGWLYLPLEQDQSVMPQRAIARVQALIASGIRPQGFIVAHEAPAVLAAPKKHKKPIELPRLPWETVGKVATTAVMAIAAALGVMALALGYMIASGLMLDPALIIVLQDGTWVEVMRWHE